MDINHIKKLYYSIGDVSKITDLKQYVLRYWETEFEILSPQKNRAGNRVYKEIDIQLILFIKHLLYDKKYTIQGARELIRHYSEEKNLNDVLYNFENLNIRSNISDPEEIIGKIRQNIKEIVTILDEILT